MSGGLGYKNCLKNGENTIMSGNPKEKWKIISAIAIVLFFTGYAGMHTQAAEEKAESFILSYQGRNTDIVIPITDCTCEYDGGDFRIYTRLIEEELLEDYDRDFPRRAQVVYLWAPDDSRQIFPVHDYCIDEKNGDVYFLFRDKNGAFIGVYRYTALERSGSGRIIIAGEKILSARQVQDWLAEACGLPAGGSWAEFSDMQVVLGALESEQGNFLLKGEASGICEETGQRYYTSWEIAPETGEEKNTPHTRKIYDEEADKEVFDACDRAFDRIEQMDWSVLVPGELNYFAGVWDLCRMDVNGDGLPELISVEGDREGPVFPIAHIYAYTGGMTKTVELVDVDLNDYTEYLYLGGNGNLIYDYSNFGVIDHGQYEQYQFDENWDRELLQRLEVYYFWKEGYDEEETERLKEGYPDTYGKRGGGYYYFQSRPGADGELVKKELTKNAFMKAYLEMTGFDFRTINGVDFPHDD